MVDVFDRTIMYRVSEKGRRERDEGVRTEDRSRGSETNPPFAFIFVEVVFVLLETLDIRIARRVFPLTSS